MYLPLELFERYDRYDDSITTGDLSVGTQVNNGKALCNKDSSKNGKCPKRME
jgi:hypothetical protein